MNMYLIVALLCACLAAAFLLFWRAGLFDEYPGPARLALVSATAALYMAMQGLAIAGGVYASSIYAWAAHVVSGGGLWSSVLVLGSAVAAIRLLTFRRGPSRHRTAYAWLSWILVVALTATAAKVTFGIKPPPGPIEAVAVSLFSWRLIAHRGNLAHLLRADVQRIAAQLRRAWSAVSGVVRSASW